MRIRDIHESSPLTFKGSVTKDLMISKYWICEILKELDLTDFSTVYILGSWYGNMAYILHRCDIDFEKIINVDINRKWLGFSHRMLKHAGIDNVESMRKDANDLDYRQVDKNSLVINTSVPDIQGHAWFDNIPDGTLVVLQDRDEDPDPKILDRFKFSEILYQGHRELEDLETTYTRYMIIGRK